MNEERPIEKLLRRHAQKRADEAGPPPELHPATRRILQDEVARQFRPAPASGGAGFWSRLRSPWMLTTMAAAVVVILAVVLPPIFKENRTTELAQADHEAAPADRFFQPVQPAPANAPQQPVATETAAAPPVLSELQSKPDPATIPNEGSAKARETTAPARRLAGEPASQPALSPATRSAKNAETRTSSAKDVATLSVVTNSISPEPAASFAAAAPSEPKPNALGGIASVRTDRPAGVAAGVNADRDAVEAVSKSPALAVKNLADSAHFYKSAAVNETASLATARVQTQAFSNRASYGDPQTLDDVKSASVVLQNFQVTQSGTELRVIDQDGSVYTGPSEAVTLLDSRSKTKTEAVQRSPRAETASRSYQQTSTDKLAPALVTYRVSGTNRTLNQPVVFTWNFVQQTNAPASVQNAFTAPAPGRAGELKDVSELLQNSVINGRAQVNEKREFEVNAVPVPEQSPK